MSDHSRIDFDALEKDIIQKQNDEEVQENVCYELWKLTCSDTVPMEHADILSRRFLPLLQDSMAHHPRNDKIQRFACGAVSNLARIEANKRKIVQMGFLPVIKSSLQLLTGNKLFQEIGMHALFNITAAVPENKSAIMKEGFLPIIKKSIVSYPDLKFAYSVLSGLCGVQANRQIICQQNFLPLILNGIRSGNSVIMEASCDSLGNLAADPKNQVTFARYLDTVHDLLIRHGHENGIAGSACVFFANFALKEKNSYVLVRNGYLQFIRDAMRNHPTIVKVQSMGAAAVRNIACPKRNRVHVVNEGFLPICRDALKHLSSSVSLARNVCFAVRNIAVSKEFRVTVVEEGFLPYIREVMKIHERDSELQLHACKLLAVLSLEVKNKEVLIEDGIAERLEAAMSRYPNSATYSLAAGALSRLGYRKSTRCCSIM